MKYLNSKKTIFKIGYLILFTILNFQIALGQEETNGGNTAPAVNNFIQEAKSWRPTSENLLEISAITLSILLIIFIIAILKSNRKLKEHEQELETQYDKIQDQYRTLLRIKKDVKATKKFELAAESASDQIVITDPDGIILYANPAIEKISGFNPDEVLGKKAGSEELWGGQMDKDFYKRFWYIVKDKKRSFKGTFENRRKDGKTYYAQSTVSPILNKEGEVQFFIGIERDITKEREVDKMKDDFISLASHQLRTPLSAIRWYLEMLIDGSVGKLTDEQKKYAKDVYESNQRMINLVNALLNVSRIESGRIIVDPKPTDVLELVEDLIEESRIKLENRNQKVILSAHNSLPKIRLDPRLIRNVYLNLLNNAIKYSPKEAVIEIFVSKNEREIISQITDHGYGIPKNEQDKIFEKFFRSSNAVKFDPSGTGLGLYLSKAIVESSGGSIWFESDENGTSFWFTIPLSGMKAKKGEVRIDS